MTYFKKTTLYNTWMVYNIFTFTHDFLHTCPFIAHTTAVRSSPNSSDLTLTHWSFELVGNLMG